MDASPRRESGVRDPSRALSGRQPKDHAASIVTPVQETFAEAMEFTSEFTPRAFPDLIKHLEPSWVEEALLSTGTATIRRRRMPAEQTVWLVLGMAVMRDMPITTMARQLNIALPASDGGRTVASKRTDTSESSAWAQIRWNGCSCDRPRNGLIEARGPTDGVGWVCTASTGRRCELRTVPRIESTLAARTRGVTRVVATTVKRLPVDADGGRDGAAIPSPRRGDPSDHSASMSACYATSLWEYGA